MAIDETVQLPAKPVHLGVRTAVMCSLEVAAQGFKMFGSLGRYKGPVAHVDSLGWTLRLIGYSKFHGIRWSTKPRKPMNIPELSKKWCDAIAGMCLAHDKATYDANDAKADDLLGPIMTAPVKQVREFYHKLKEDLGADTRIPFLVLMAFDAWGTVTVADAPDEGVKQLKKKLAEDIAELVEKPAAEQLPAAIARALQWRPESQLQEVKAALKKGAKPKLVGRESCLFLEVGKGPKKVSVMI
jgi:hypothetical protein